jgi:glycosyltransferase involved in cell wall biosynthesis
MVAITIGLPFHNASNSIGDAIRSVFAQTFADWELLLVDDGSTDGSVDIARRVRDGRVRVLSDGENRRLPARLNQIVDAAHGEFIARLDADDMMHPERLARQVRLLTEQRAVDFVGTACFTLNASGEVMSVIASEPVRVDARHVLRRGLLAHATLLLRRSWCQANRYDERFSRAEDRELFCRTLTTSRFAQIREPLYFVGYRKDARTALRDYIATSHDNRKIFGLYARRLVGRFAAASLIVESLAKEVAFRTATAIGQQNVLLRRRGRPATEEERQRADAVLRRIQVTGVEGLH